MARFNDSELEHVKEFETNKEEHEEPEIPELCEKKSEKHVHVQKKEKWKPPKKKIDRQQTKFVGGFSNMQWSDEDRVRFIFIFF